MDHYVFTAFYLGLFIYWIYCNVKFVNYRIKLMNKYKFRRSVYVTLKRLKDDTEATEDEIEHFRKLRNRTYWAIPLILLLSLTITPLLLWLLGKF